MIKKLCLSLLIVSTSLVFHSCSSDGKAFSTVEVEVTGEVGEILVVCEQPIWDSEIKGILDSNLTQFIMPYYPDVATFELIHKTPSHFTQGVKRYRNTMFVSVDPNIKSEKGEIKKRMSVWATDQMVVDVVAPSFEKLKELCLNGMSAVHDEFDEIEWQRLIRQHKRNQNDYINGKIAKAFGIKMHLPDHSSIVWYRENFMRIELPEISRPIEFIGAGNQDNGNIFSGVMIYQYNFVDSSQLSLEILLMARDTMLKYNVPHEYEGMYMGTQYADVVYPEIEKTTNLQQTISGYDVRGMFVFKGKGMNGTGGAFWSFHFVNPKNKKLMCVSGYVDAPSTTSWTHSLRVMQAVCRSVEII